MKRSFLLLLAAAWLAAADVRAADWYTWRGPEQNGVSLETDLPDHWSPEPNDPENNLVWKNSYGGRSTPIGMNGRVYLINSAGAGTTAQERIACLDADTDKVLWERLFPVFHTDIGILRDGWPNPA